MKGHLQMSEKERRRLGVLERVVRKEITLAAAQQLQVRGRHMPFVAYPAVMAFHPMLDNRVRHERYFNHLADTVRPIVRKAPPAVRATIQRVLHNLGGSLPMTNVGTRALLADFLLARNPVRFHKRRNSAGHSRRRVLAKPLILRFQGGYPLGHLMEQGDQFFSREGFEVLHTLLFA